MSRQNGKVIISCAVTGSIHTPSMTDHLPITPEQIADDAVGAAEAGAAILHLHARDPKTGKPDQTPEAFLRFVPAIRRRTDAIINITTGGSPYNSIAERIRPALELKPELASLNMGSMNFGLFRIAEKIATFKHDWERDHLLKTRANIFRNTFEDIEEILTVCGAAGTRFEFECYDTSHLYTLAHFVERGLVKPPFFVQSVFGILGGVGTHAEDVQHMKRTADRLFGGDYLWSVLGAGAAQLRIATQAVALGGNVRVGLEDSIWAGKGKLATSSAEQVRMIRQVIEGQGLSIATPDEARAMLGTRTGGTVLLQPAAASA
ncbi:MAG: 3-keto-5-aminohexanoate cleavage protein [Rhizobiaceae bacterium]|nr:3-keto-5-aminohexanoate cleavage protein [Rhizobiaceae bacterium]